MLPTPAERAWGVFPEEFLRSPPKGPGGRRTGESALTHAQLRASGWMPRPPRRVPGAGHPGFGFGKIMVPQVVVERASLVCEIPGQALLETPPSGKLSSPNAHTSLSHFL